MLLVFTVISETEWWKASLEETRVHWGVQVDEGSEWGHKSQVKQGRAHIQESCTCLGWGSGIDNMRGWRGWNQRCKVGGIPSYCHREDVPFCLERDGEPSCCRAVRRLREGKDWSRDQLGDLTVVWIRDDGDLDQHGSNEVGRWLDSGCALKVETGGFSECKV